MCDDQTISKTRFILLGATIACVYCIWGVCATLLPPFFPIEAKSKGATITQSGSVFGIYSLAGLISSPFFAKYGSRMSPKYLYIPSSMTQAICTFLFGGLFYIDDLALFLGLAHLLRICSGMAIAASWGSLLASLLGLFPNSASKIMGATELFYGAGYMLGPAFGGFLYDTGGFSLPFVVAGTISIISSVMLCVSFPNDCDLPRKEKMCNTNTKLSCADLIIRKGILIPLLDTFSACLSLSMIEATLGMYLKSTGSSQSIITVTFCVSGGCYMLSTIVSGLMTDRLTYPISVSIFGNMCIITAFIFILPPYFIPKGYITLSTWICMSVFGFGIGVSYVSSYKRAKDYVIRNGFQQTTRTYHLLSGLWVSGWFMGYFLGPIIGSYITELYGFGHAIFVCLLLHIIMFVGDIGELIQQVYHDVSKAAPYKRIDNMETTEEEK